MPFFPVIDASGLGSAPQADALDVVVHRVRKRLVGAAVEIVTLRGIGYLLCEDPAEMVGMMKGSQA